MSNKSEFDTTKLIALLVQKNLENLVTSAKSVAKRAAGGIEAKLRKSYSSYLLSAAEHYGTARTFFIRDQREPLYNYYVPLELKTGNSSLPNASVKKIAKAGSRAVVVGAAGCGKSTLMRHLFLDSIRDGKRIPVFVELNQLKEENEIDLWDLVYRSFRAHKLKLSKAQITAALKSGGFAVLLDGLDEVEEAIKTDTVNAIADFAADLPSSSLLIVSSRPDVSYATLKSFNHFTVQPLSCSKAVELVTKLPFEEEIRTKFAQELKASLYDDHKSFLSNPLLLSIMLLTYGQSASIPNKICIFYNQAYEALFQTHDAYKGGYSRKRLTDLDIREFEEVFSAFALVSYDARRHSFPRTECLEYLRRASKLSRVEINAENFMNDCLRAVSLLMEDGLNVTFVHRSFQEYFAARYISRVDVESKKKLLDRLGVRSVTENVLNLYWELDRNCLEDHWLIPQLEEIRLRIGVKNKVGITHYTRYLKFMFDTLSFFQKEDGYQGLLIGYDSNDSDEDLMRRAAFLAFSKYYRGSESYKKINSQQGKYLSKLTKMLPVDDDSIVTDDIKMRSPMASVLSNIGGLVSIDFVQKLADLPATISQERADSKESLESILGLGD